VGISATEHFEAFWSISLRDVAIRCVLLRNCFGRLMASMQKPIDQPPMNLAHNIEELLTI